MTDETANLVLEHLKRFQTQMNRIEERLTSIEVDMRAVKQHIGALVSSDANRDSKMASFELRLDRIERRLELRE